MIDRLLRLLEPLCLIAMPCVLGYSALHADASSGLTALIMAVLSLLPFFARFERARPRPRDIMPIVILAAVATAGRLLFAPFPNFKPVSAIVIVAGASLGRQRGFLVGALGALCSNLFFGQGAWTPWQMLAWGSMGYGAGMLGERRLLRTRWQAVLYGALASFGFGFVMDTWFLIAFVRPDSLAAAWPTYLAGMPFNLSHAVSTVLFLLCIFVPWRKKLTHLVQKFGLYARGE